MMIMIQEMDDDDDDEDKYADDMAMPGQKFETKQRITVRNLRIREDTAKVCVMWFAVCCLSAYLDSICLVWFVGINVVYSTF